MIERHDVQQAERIKLVRKRDGRVVPFQREKIAEAIYQAAKACGREDSHMADELSRAITLYMEKTLGDGVLGIEKIQEAVEKVLVETGHEEVAQAYAAYRRERDRYRQNLEVRKSEEIDLFDLPMVEATSAQKTTAWDRSRITSALEREAGLEASLAREISHAVERKIFSSGIRRVSTTLIRALVDNELFERGMTAAQRKQRLIGIPAHDLEKLFMEDPTGTREKISDVILRQFFLYSVLSVETSRAHLEARIHVQGADDPLAERSPLTIYISDETDTTRAVRKAIEGTPTRFSFHPSPKGMLRLPTVTLNLVSIAKETPPGRSNLCLEMERTVNLAVRAHAERALFVEKVRQNTDMRFIAPVGFMGLNECASMREENPLRLVRWVKRCLETHNRGGNIEYVLTTECFGAERAHGHNISEGIGITGTPLQRLFFLHDLAGEFHEAVLQIRHDRLREERQLEEILDQAKRLSSIHAVLVH